MTLNPLAAQLAYASNKIMATIQRIGRVSLRDLTNEEALREYGTSFVFVGTPPAPPPRQRPRSSQRAASPPAPAKSSALIGKVCKLPSRTG